MTKIKTYLLTIICLLTLTTCKKRDRLIGNFHILVGHWQWVMTTGGIAGQTKYPSTWNDRVILFHEKGKYEIYHGENKASYGNMHIQGNHITFGQHHFFLSDKWKLDELGGTQFDLSCIHGDSLFLTNTTSLHNAPDNYTDVYIRQK